MVCFAPLRLGKGRLPKRMVLRYWSSPGLKAALAREVAYLRRVVAEVEAGA